MAESAGKKKVLVIDDEMPVQNALKDVLEERGYTCIAAPDGEKGLASALAEKPDLIVLDVLMPRLDGLAMLRELRKDEWGARARVLVLTNLSANSSDRVRALVETAPDFYLVKSDWPIAEVASKIEEMMAA